MQCYHVEVVIGFLNTSYTVGESDSQVNIQIGVIRGSLQIPVVVEFSIPFGIKRCTEATGC